MALGPLESKALGGIRVVGSFEAAPASHTGDEVEDSLLFCMGLGAEPRGLYMQKADGTYELIGGGGGSAGYQTLGSFAQVATATTTAEQDILVVNIPANSLGNDKQFRVNFGGRLRNSAGNNQTMRFRIYYGSTLMYDDTTATLGSSTNERGMWFTLLLTAQGSTNSQDLSGLIAVGGTGSAVVGGGDLGSDEITSHAPIDGVATEDSTQDRTFRVTVTMSTASASLYATRYRCIPEIIG